MKYSSIPSAQALVQHCKSKGIQHIVISPGSRNAPLTIGFTENPFFSCFSIVDERCAGFFALGIAQQTKSAVALVCTSGSALLNYYPAIAEAFYSNISLVIVSADRPAYKIDVGDGQTIRQDDVFHRHIGYAANLKQDVTHATAKVRNYLKNLPAEEALAPYQLEIQDYNDTQIDKALTTAIHQDTPVHINIPFEEPLYNVLEQPTVVPFVPVTEEPLEERTKSLEQFTETWNKASKKMILVGVNEPNSIEQHFLDELAEDPSVLVFTETTSNLHHPSFLTSIDSIIAPIEKAATAHTLFEQLRPAILLTFGGLIVSKKIKAFLRTYKPEQHWHVGTKKANNTFFSLSHHFKNDPNTFFSDFLSGVLPRTSNYQLFWTNIRDAYVAKRGDYISQISFSDFLAFHHITKSIPSGYQLQLANSSTVRYAQLFDIERTITVYCNRGTSGIDGSTSTAIGASLFCSTPTLLITGDLSFFYDSNALWNNYLRADFRIIVVNNGGGGIFRILPGMTNTENYERYFETSHELNAAQLCAMYQIEYQAVRSEESLQEVLADFYLKSDQPKLLEVHTPRILNEKILLSYFDFIS